MTQTTSSMMFASAVSDAGHADTALTEMVGRLSHRLPGDADLLVVFATPEYADALDHLGRALRESLGARVVIGCTAQGVVGIGRELEGGPAVSVLAGVLPGVRIEPLRYDPIDYPSVIDSAQTLREATGIRPDHDDPEAVLLLVDAYSTPLAGLLPAFGAALPGVAVAGGLASGGSRPRDSRLLLNGRVFRDGAVGLSLSGAVSVQTTVSPGCRPVGRPWVITRAKRNVVQELGGQPAMDVLRQTLRGLDERDRELAQATGLQVGRVIDEQKPRFGRGDFLIRGLVGIDPDAGYMVIGDPQVRAGQTVQFMVRDARTASEDLAMMLDAQRLYGRGEGALLFTCNDRGTRLFERRDADATLIGEALGEVPLAGFFAAGEIGPIAGEPYLHGQTASLVVFRAAG